MSSAVPCDNCRTNFDPAKGGIVVTQRDHHTAAICDPCMDNTTLIKVVLRRISNAHNFRYDQYSGLEMYSSK